VIFSEKFPVNQPATFTWSTKNLFYLKYKQLQIKKPRTIFIWTLSVRGTCKAGNNSLFCYLFLLLAVTEN